jgi:aldehyde dehydrogenase (NAD+)
VTNCAPVPLLDAQWIGGRWRGPSSAAVIEVEDPATVEVVGAVPAGAAADADAAVAAAARAFPGWADTPLPRRTELVARIVDGLAARADKLATVITTEVGAPVAVARQTQVGLAVSMARSFLPLATTLEEEERVGNSLVVRRPAGVVAAITPWNVPLLLAVQKIVPALLAGCTVVHKPSELTPLHTALLIDSVAEADLPPGVFNLVIGTGVEVGRALTAHPDVDVVSFTGSTLGGRDVARNGADTIKRLHLELGGKSACLVLEDADLERAVRANVDQVCFNSGQTCLQWSRLLVPRAREHEALELAAELMAGYRVGDPTAPETDLGPLISRAALHRVRAHLLRAVAEGAQLITGGPQPVPGLDRGHYILPTLVGGVRPDMAIALEEVFGPVLSVLPYDDEDDAVRIANGTRYGLHGAVFSDDDDRALRVARRLRTGLVDVNGGSFNPLAPFGGFGLSGVGRECGPVGLASFCETASYQLPAAQNGPMGPQLRT